MFYDVLILVHTLLTLLLSRTYFAEKVLRILLKKISFFLYATNCGDRCVAHELVTTLLDVVLQIYKHCAEIDTTGLKDPRLHENTKVSALYNLGRLLADEEKHQVSTMVRGQGINTPHIC